MDNFLVVFGIIGCTKDKKNPDKKIFLHKSLEMRKLFDKILNVNALKSLGTACIGRPPIFIINDRELVLKDIAINSILHCFASKSRNLLMRTVVEIIVSSVDMLGTGY